MECLLAFRSSLHPEDNIFVPLVGQVLPRIWEVPSLNLGCRTNVSCEFTQFRQANTGKFRTSHDRILPNYVAKLNNRCR